MPSRKKPYTGTWTLRPDYVRACDWTPRPDGRTTYLEVRRGTGEDVTSFHPGQWDWSLINLPEIIYQLKKDPSWDEFKSSELPPQKVDNQGIPLVERWPKPGEAPRPLLDFRILPDQIGTEEESWYLETIRRLDPRITYGDIAMRMMNVNTRRETTEKQFYNLYINNPLTRSFRPRFNIISWHGKVNEANSRVMGKLSLVQISANTTRGLTPGLMDPNQPDGPRVPLPETPRSRGRMPGIRTRSAPQPPTQTSSPTLQPGLDDAYSPPVQPRTASRDLVNENKDQLVQEPALSYSTSSYQQSPSQNVEPNFQHDPWRSEMDQVSSSWQLGRQMTSPVSQKVFPRAGQYHSIPADPFLGCIGPPSPFQTHAPTPQPTVFNHIRYSGQMSLPQASPPLTGWSPFCTIPTSASSSQATGNSLRLPLFDPLMGYQTTAGSAEAVNNFFTGAETFSINSMERHHRDDITQRDQSSFQISAPSEPKDQTKRKRTKASEREGEFASPDVESPVPTKCRRTSGHSQSSPSASQRLARNPPGLTPNPYRLLKPKPRENLEKMPTKD